MARRVILIRHGDDPPEDRAYGFLRASGYEPVERRPFRGETLDAIDGSVAGAVIYGGGFGVNETARFPFLVDEMRWIEQCMSAGLPLLGICQGGQQIARVLGAEVFAPESGAHEFGYYPLYAADGAEDFLPEPIHVAQAHFHEFALPSGARRLAFSDLFANQAFSYGERTYALQFHPEVSPAGFRRWQDAPWALYGKPGVQTRAEQDRLIALHDCAQKEWFESFLSRLFGRAEA